jgi:hypothetical protein
VLSGGHYDLIDFTIQNRLETGTPEAQLAIRTWLKHLSAFAHSLDLAKARPLPQMVKTAPEHVIASVLGVEAQEYAIYLADAREVTEKGLGELIEGDLTLSLPEGSWQISYLAPESGKRTEGKTVQGGNAVLRLPAFNHDTALRITRQP